jgi:excisionase family DNA binding protein
MELDCQTESWRLAVGRSAVSNSETQAGDEVAGSEVLTLAEIAAYLRVPEDAVLALVAKDMLPAQEIGGEWRFLKRAVVEWLRLGPHCYQDFKRFSPAWMHVYPFWEDLLEALEQRILSKLPVSERTAAQRGSKQAVLRHFGVFQDDADMEAQLASTRARREAAGK